MPIVRADRNTGNYGCSNILYLNRKDLSARAKIVMASIVGRSDNWIVNLDYMAEHWFKESRNWIYEGLLELEAFGYVKRTRTRDEQGKYGPTEYTIYELPQTENTENTNSSSPSSNAPKADSAPASTTQSPSPSKPRPVNPRPVNPLPVKPALVSGGVYTSNNKQELNNQKNKQTKDLSVVSFSGSKTIGDSIDEPQRNHIRQVLQSLPKQPTNLDDLTDQVIFVLLDKNAFTRAEGNFSRKLNSIAKVIREGRWETPSAYKSKQSASSPAAQEAKKLNDLKSKIATVEHQIHSSQIAKQASENIPELAEGHKKTIEINQAKLAELKTALRAFSPPNAMDAAHSLVSKHVNAETTTDTRIRTLKEKKRLLLQQLSSAKSAQAQFKDYPAIADQHAKSITEYEQSLLNLDTELQTLIQPKTDASHRSCHA